MENKGYDEADYGVENNHFVLVSSALICLSSRKSIRVSRIRKSREQVIITPWRNFKLPVNKLASRKNKVRPERYSLIKHTIVCSLS